MHLARTVTRRLERSMVAIKEEMRPLSLQYVNRLSDLDIRAYKMDFGKAW